MKHQPVFRMAADLTPFATTPPASRRRSFVHFLLRWFRKATGSAHKPAPVKQPSAALPDDVDENFRQMTFTFAVIALAAKLASVDGKVKKEEFLTFCRLFPLPGEERTKIHKLFVMACKESTDAAHYARQIANLFPGRASLFTELVMRLCRLAIADGRATSAEKQLLEKVADVLGVSRDVIRVGLAAALPPVSDDPYALLGVTRKSGAEALKKAYRERIRELHPDQMAVADYAPEEIEAAHTALAAVNEAYSVITRKRNAR